jgi:hypothetical protein
MIECPKCGSENALGRLFCESCGQKLDVEGIHPKIQDQPLRRGKRRRRKSGTGNRRVPRLLLGLVIVAVIITPPLLAAWRPELPVVQGSLAQAARYRRDRDRLLMLSLGQGAKVGVRQDDLNSYIELVRRRRAPMSRVVVAFTADGVNAYVSKEFLGVELVSVFRWATGGGGETPAFRPAGFSVGRLPLPVAVIPWAAKQFPEVLQAFDTEFRIVNNCVSARVPDAGRLILDVKFSS